MIVRIIWFLALLYLGLVCAGVAIVAGLQESLGFFGALGLAMALFLGSAALVAMLIRRRVARLTAMLRGGTIEMVRSRGP
jgi:hypothetical protein